MNHIVAVHKTFFKFEKRAENKPDELISSTFVDAEPLIDIVSAPLSQIIFGRRGTGKTHALKYCMARVREMGKIAVYLDIRAIGSNGSFYSDADIPEVERGLRLVDDILKALIDELYPLALEKIEEGNDPKQITLRLDDMIDAVGNIKVSGVTTISSESEVHHKGSLEAGGQLDVSPVSLSSRLFGSTKKEKVESGKETETIAGRTVRSIDFAQTQVCLKGLLDILGVDQMWLFLDEWSETPRVIQPYLADLIRKTILPTGKIVVKIGAIEHRSTFVVHRNTGDYIGLELGADIGSDLNLDDFLVFDNNEKKAINFFKELIYKNYLALAGDDAEVSSANELSNILFTEKRAVEEFTRAVEGVPRDALNLVSKVVTRAFGKQAGVDDIRKAALDWYTQDKANTVTNSPILHQVLNHIVDEVIGNRRARAFLFPSGLRHEVIDNLFDFRLLHLLKKNVSSRDEPGKRYDVWKIDYGCYVDMIRTQQAPLGLLPDENDQYVEVPSDDYRSIRRAVLTPNALDAYLEQAQAQ